MPICSGITVASRPALASSSFRVAAAPRQAPPRRCLPARRRLRARLVPKSTDAIPIGAKNDDDADVGAASTSAPSQPPSSSTDPMRPYRRAQSRAMWRFMLPAALIPLADPLLTLVDVLFVSHGGDLLSPPALGGGAAGALGRAFLLSSASPSSSSSSSPSPSSSSSLLATATEQLAALSPNAQIFTFIQYMLGGLGQSFI